MQVSLSPQRNDTQPAAIAAGCFRVRRPGSLLTGRRARKQTRGPSGPTAVGHSFARTPREGTEMPQAQRRGISLFSFTPICRTKRKKPYLPTRILDYR